MSGPPSPAPAPAIECTGLRYRFGDHVAVDGVDFEVRTGEMFGLHQPYHLGMPKTA